MSNTGNIEISSKVNEGPKCSTFKNQNVSS